MLDRLCGVRRRNTLSFVKRLLVSELREGFQHLAGEDPEFHIPSESLFQGGGQLAIEWILDQRHHLLSVDSQWEERIDPMPISPDLPAPLPCGYLRKG